MTPTPPEPTPQDHLAAERICAPLGYMDPSPLLDGIALAIARARHAGEVAERERCARVADTEAVACGRRDGDGWDMCRTTALIIAREIRSLAPAEKPAAGPGGGNRD